MEPEDFDENGREYLEDDVSRLRDQVIRVREKIFSEGCLEAYNLLELHGSLYLSKVDDQKLALNKMLGYFIQIEHYEKCSIIKKIYQEVFLEIPTPTLPNFQEYE
jgi:hypothetical protein